jgi:hypothetical protein
MRDKKTVQSQFSKQEIRIIEQLRQHPEMMARFQSILELTDNPDGPLKTADVRPAIQLSIALAINPIDDETESQTQSVSAE